MKRGSIEFLYRKDSSKQEDGWISGLFSVYMNEETLLEDKNLSDDPTDWKYFHYDVFPGMHEFSFIYQKFNTEANAHMKLEIKELKVTGLDFADLECSPCKIGSS